MLALATAAEPDWAEQGQFFVALVGLILTVAGLAFVWIQVRAIRQEGRADRVSALMARLQDRELLRTRVAALRYVRITSPEECYERLLTWEDAESGETPLMPGHHEPVPSMNDCRHVMLFFEELAGLFNTGAVDVDLAERLFSNIVVETFDQYWWLVGWWRGVDEQQEENDHERAHIRIVLDDAGA